MSVASRQLKQLLLFSAAAYVWASPSVYAESSKRLMQAAKSAGSGKLPKLDAKYVEVKHFSGEVVPGYAVNLTFKISHCPISSVLPDVKEYESQTSLPSYLA